MLCARLPKRTPGVFAPLDETLCTRSPARTVPDLTAIVSHVIRVPFAPNHPMADHRHWGQVIIAGYWRDNPLD